MCVSFCVCEKATFVSDAANIRIIAIDAASRYRLAATYE